MVSFDVDDAAGGASLEDENERCVTASTEIRDCEVDASALPVPASLSKLHTPGVCVPNLCIDGCEGNVNLEHGAGSQMLGNMRTTLKILLQQQEDCKANLISLIEYMDSMGASSAREDFDNMGIASQEALSTRTSCGKGDAESKREENLKTQISDNQLDSHSVTLEPDMRSKTSAASEEGHGMYKMQSLKKVKRKTLRLSNALEAARKSIEGRSRNASGAQEQVFPCRVACQSLLESPRFDYLIGFVIFVNSICVGIETQFSLEFGAENKWPQDVDAVFVCIYAIELVLRIFGYGAKNFSDAWFLFDFVLVILGIISNILLPLCIALSLFPSKPRFLDPVLVVRSFRLLRFLRAVRMLKQFRIIWRLVYGLLTSMNAMVSTLVLLTLTLYVFACLGVEIISKDAELQAHDDTALVVEQHFSSLPATLLTFLQFISLDSCAAIYSPLIKRNPALILYFLAVMFVVPIALMNLVTAVLVEGALENAEADKQLHASEMHEVLIDALPKLEQIFQTMDDDGDGMLTQMEVRNIPSEMIPEELFKQGSVSSMEDLFLMLDVDGRGWLLKDEFLDGLISVLVMNVPIQTVQTLKLLYNIAEGLQNGVKDIKRGLSHDERRLE
eukprot:TRINITY_DN31078_c0_g1_i1.p1 TRINITY_DN31078_c0_g1~~TRINITY_DN31078_c0_g1_i1.p1  ORF type:complete len:616 (-),score=106.99 TRINITY_DN31078_c0_g1_i1:3-1850(-)